MTSVKIGTKAYTIHDTLLVKEYGQVMSMLKLVKNIDEIIKSGDTDAIKNAMEELQRITIQDWEFLNDIVKRCCKIKKEDFDNLHYADLLVLFSHILNETRNPKKNLSTASS